MEYIVCQEKNNTIYGINKKETKYSAKAYCHKKRCCPLALLKKFTFRQILNSMKMNILVKIVTWTLFLYLVYCGLLFVMQRRVLFPRHLIELPSNTENIPGLEKIWVERRKLKALRNAVEMSVNPCEVEGLAGGLNQGISPR